MSHSSGDITTDSVPDAPRPQSEKPADDVNEKETFSEEENETEEPKVEEEPKPKKAGTARPGQSTSKPNYGSASANMICINNANNIHIGHNISVNSVTSSCQPSKRTEQEPRKKKTKEIKDTCRSNENVSEDDIDVVAEHVGREWKTLGSYLGYTGGQLDQFYEDHRKIGLREVIYKMLIDWKQYKADKASIGILCKGLWEARQYDAAAQLTKLRIARAEKQS